MIFQLLVFHIKTLEFSKWQTINESSTQSIHVLHSSLPQHERALTAASIVTTANATNLKLIQHQDKPGREFVRRPCPWVRSSNARTRSRSGDKAGWRCILGRIRNYRISSSSSCILCKQGFGGVPHLMQSYRCLPCASLQNATATPPPLSIISVRAEFTHASRLQDQDS